MTSPGQQDVSEAVQLLNALLVIPGPSGQEAPVARQVQRLIREAGAKSAQFRTDDAHRHSPLGGEMGNLMLDLPGSRPGPRRLLMAHLDTVPICVGAQPKREGDTITSANPQSGLGADNRAGTAVLVFTARRLLREQPPHPPITFLWTVQEEVGLQGARQLNPDWLGRPCHGFNWDGGTPEKVTIGATGGYRMQIDVFGQASHAGNAPEAGVNAITIASLAIADLQTNGWHGLIVQGAQSGTSNFGVIAGGRATNVVPDHVQLKCEARSHNAEFRNQIVQQIRDAFQRAVAAVPSDSGDQGRVDFDGRLDYESFCLPTDHPVIGQAQRAVRQAGLEPELAVANGGLDANWLTQHGIPTVSFGCGQHGQHQLDESLNVPQYLSACDIAWQLACADDEPAAMKVDSAEES